MEIKDKDKRLLEVIASEEHKFWFILWKKYLNQSLIDKRLLENYKNQGYYKVKILNSFAELNEDSFKLIYNIDLENVFI